MLSTYTTYEFVLLLEYRSRVTPLQYHQRLVSADVHT